MYIRYPEGFEWDPDKSRSNLHKHAVDFVDAVGVFEDPNSFTVSDPHLEEERYLTLGMDYLARVLVVSWTWAGDKIRIISAWRASRRQRTLYEEGNQ